MSENRYVELQSQGSRFDVVADVWNGGAFLRYRDAEIDMEDGLEINLDEARELVKLLEASQ